MKAIILMQQILKRPKTPIREIPDLHEYGAVPCFYTSALISQCMLFAPAGPGRAVILTTVHLARASAVKTRWFAMYDVWIVHVSTLGAARLPSRKWYQKINNKLFGAELLIVAQSALVSGNQVLKLSPWERHFQIVAND